MCGENTSTTSPLSREKGSPPRVRGKQAVEVMLIERVRITPACAGKTLIQLHRPRAVQDHPRVCGENLLTLLFSCGTAGSPPRVRGKQSKYASTPRRCRITPACAGKTKFADMVIVPEQDHPRVCGENMRWSSSQSACSGSPPRVRGKPGRIFAVQDGARITPACAGKTPDSPAQ